MSAYRRRVVRVIALLCFGLGGCASERVASRASSHPITSTAEESTVTRTPHLTPETPMTQGAIESERRLAELARGQRQARRWLRLDAFACCATHTPR